MRPTLDLTGRKFDRLTVLRPDVTKGYWIVRCSCGGEKAVRGASLTSGNTRSCGCKVRNNPGRPKRPKYSPHIPLGTFVYDTFEQMSPIRNALARQGVVINGSGELRYAGRVEQYRDAYEALGQALIKCIQHNVQKN